MKDIKLWIDDKNKAPEGYVWCKTVEEAKKILVPLYMGYASYLHINPNASFPVKLLDFGSCGIELLEWFKKIQAPRIPICFHSESKETNQMMTYVKTIKWKE